MPVQLIRRVRDRQPQRHVGIARGNPISAGIKEAVYSMAGHVPSFGPITISHAAQSVRMPTPNGLGRKYTFSGYAANYTSISGSVSTPKATHMFVGVRGADTGNPNAFAVIERNLIINADGTVTLTNGSGAYTTSTKTIAVGEFFVIFAWGADYDILAIDINGEVSTFNNSGGWGGLGSVTIIGGDASWGSGNNTAIAYASWSRYLSAAERAALRVNPWQIFAPETIPLFFSTVTAQFLRPISDVSNSGWTPSTGTDLFSCIGETVRNDATYISATAPGAICEVLLGTSSGDPLSSINHLPRIVMSAGTGGIIVRLKQGATLIKEWTYASLAATDTLYEPTLTSGEIDAITDYTNLRLEMETTA